MTSETRFFALSWPPAPEVLLATVRDLGPSRMPCIVQLYVSFREDAARNRKDNGPQILPRARRCPSRYVQKRHCLSNSNEQAGSEPSCATFSLIYQQLRPKAIAPPLEESPIKVISLLFTLEHIVLVGTSINCKSARGGLYKPLI